MPQYMCNICKEYIASVESDGYKIVPNCIVCRTAMSPISAELFDEYLLANVGSGRTEITFKKGNKEIGTGLGIFLQSDNKQN